MVEQKLASNRSQTSKGLPEQIVEAALEVHKNMGLGFGKKEYCRALAHEFNLRKLLFEEKKKIKLSYKGSVAGEYNLDFAIQNSLAVLVSTGENLTEIETTRLRNILKTVRLRTGIILNFSKDILEIKTVER